MDIVLKASELRLAGAVKGRCCGRQKKPSASSIAYFDQVIKLFASLSPVHDKSNDPHQNRSSFGNTGKKN